MNHNFVQAYIKRNTSVLLPIYNYIYWNNQRWEQENGKVEVTCSFSETLVLM